MAAGLRHPCLHGVRRRGRPLEGFVRLPVAGTICHDHARYLAAVWCGCNKRFRTQPSSRLRRIPWPDLTGDNPTGDHSHSSITSMSGATDLCPQRARKSVGDKKTARRIRDAYDGRTQVVLGRAAPACADLQNVRSPTIPLLHLGAQPQAGGLAAWKESAVRDAQFRGVPPRWPRECATTRCPCHSRRRPARGRCARCGRRAGALAGGRSHLLSGRANLDWRPTLASMPRLVAPSTMGSHLADEWHTYFTKRGPLPTMPRRSARSHRDSRNDFAHSSICQRARGAPTSRPASCGSRPTYTVGRRPPCGSTWAVQKAFGLLEARAHICRLHLTSLWSACDRPASVPATASFTGPNPSDATPSQAPESLRARLSDHPNDLSTQVKRLR